MRNIISVIGILFLKIFHITGATTTKLRKGKDSKGAVCGMPLFLTRLMLTTISVHCFCKVFGRKLG